MSPHAYTEDQLVEQPAIGLFAALGWQTVSAMEETFGPSGTLGSETKGEVVPTDRLRAALVGHNPGFPLAVAAGEEVTDEDCKAQLQALNEKLETLNAQARTLEQTIAANVAGILEG